MTKLVGILNLTPDSFSDGGKYVDPEKAVAALHQLIEDGADMIDIGAESTRPGATILSADQEWERLTPLLDKITISKITVPLSLDTYHPANAKRALEHGFSAINDVSGFRERDMVAVMKQSHCKMVLMHSLTVPAEKDVTVPEDIDIVDYLIDFAKAHIARLEGEGVARSRIIFDPGIGFGKTANQSHTILERVSELKTIAVPLYIGHSRKSFIGAGDRDVATLDISKQLIAAKVDYIRVHDVAAHRRLV